MTEQSDDWPLGVSNPARRALAAAGITTLDQLTAHTERELLAMHGVGPKAIRLLGETLAARGQSFSPEG